MENNVENANPITLRGTLESDLEFVISSEHESENARYVGQWTKEQHISALCNKDIFHIIVEESNTCKPVGYVILAGIENPNYSIELKRIVICNKGRGLGRETIRLIKKITFEKMNAHRLWLDVRSKNCRAKELYKSEGFKEEGVLREAILYNGNYESLIVMSILEEEYKNKINTGLDIISKKA